MRGNRITTKSNLRVNLSEYIDTTAAWDSVWGKWTSGTTGPPTLIPYAPEFYFDQLYLPLVRAAIFVGADVYDEDIFSVGITDNCSCHEFVLSDPTATVGLSIQVLMRESAKSSIERAWRLLTRLRPAVVAVKPVILEALLLRATLIPSDLSFVKFFFCSGSVLSAGLRQEAEATLGRAVINGYGLTEFGMMGFECAHGSLHYDPLVFQVETVTPAGERSRAGGPGIVVVTTGTNPLLPLWRYSTGDVAVAANTLCACGRDGPRLMELAGRIQSCFRGRDGELLSPVHFVELFRTIPIKEYQVIQDEPGNLRILIEPLSTTTGTRVTDIVLEKVLQIIPNNWSVTIEMTNLSVQVGFQRHQVNLAPIRLGGRLH